MLVGLWKNKVNRLEKQIVNARQEIAAAKDYAETLFKHGKDYAAKYDSFFQPSLLETAKEMQSFLQHQPLLLVGGWQESQWQSWQPETTLIAPIIRIGQQREQRQRGELNFSFPDFAPFIGQNKTVIIVTNNQSRDIGLELLQSLVIRTALMLPHQARYTLLDPAGNGAAFPMYRQLKEAQSVRELDGNDVSRDLELVKKDIQRLNAYYLDAESESFEKLPKELRINERFEFIFAADFPNRYDRRAIEALQSVGTTGPRTGKYLFIHYNQDIPLPRDISMDEFKNGYNVDLNRNYGGGTACELKFFADAVPPSELQRFFFTKLREAKPPERKLIWDEIVGIPEGKWWSYKAESIIDTPVGGSGSSGTLQIWFGENSEGRPCAHGVLGGMPGAGKSNLYHVFILGLATRYSPEELRLYLIDGKDGVEFQPYRHLPHAEVVSLNSPVELSSSVLGELVEEKERRNNVFSKAGVVNLRDYHRQGQPLGKLPRVLLIVDEYQELFEKQEVADIASNQLLQLASQGRSVGIHILLASQRFEVPKMAHRTAIFGNVHLRMAMKMSDSDRQGLTEFGKRGKSLLTTCDLPGKIVINDRAGDDGEGANHLGKVAYLEPEGREQLLQKLQAKASTLPANSLPATVVFDGKAQPNLIENPQLHKILQYPHWLNTKEWQTLARQSVYEGGFTIPDWFTAENPQMVWLGQEFSVRGQARLIIRRKLAENVLIVGSNNAARYGMLVGIITSLAVNIHPHQVEFHIFDRSMAETEWSEAMQNVCDCVLRPAGFKVNFTRDRQNITNYLNYLLEELEKRSQLNDEQRLNLPTIFAIMTELDQVEVMRRVDDGYGLTDSPGGQQLYRLYREGSSLGIHLILSFSGIRPLINVIDERRGLVNFRHRVALQMSEDESYTFVRSRQAAKLQESGEIIPLRALYMDIENDAIIRFKPYSVESDIPLFEQLTEIGQILTSRSQTI